MAHDTDKAAPAQTSGMRRTKVGKFRKTAEEEQRIEHWRRIGRYKTEADYLRAAALAGSPDLLHDVMVKLGEREMILTELMMFRSSCHHCAQKLEDLIATLDMQHRDLRKAISGT